MHTHKSQSAARTWGRTRWMRASVYRAIRYALALGASCAVVALLFWRFAQPPIVVPPVPPPPSPNAYAGVMRAAARLYSAPDAHIAAAHFGFTKNPHTIAEMERALRPRQAAFTALRSVLQSPYEQPRDRDFNRRPGGRIVNFIEVREMARMLGTDAHVRRARGDNAGSAGSALDVIHLGVELPHGAIAIGALIGLLCEGVGQEALRPLVPNLNAAELKTTLHRLEKIRSRRASLTNAVVEDKWLALALLKYAPDDFDAAGFVSGSPLDVFLYRANFAAVGSRAVARDLAEHTDQVERVLRLPYRAAVVARAVPLKPRLWVTESIVADFEKARLQYETRRAITDLLLVSAALRLYRARTGTYPLALDELTSANVLLDVPADPFSPTAHDPFHYRRISANKYRLYSVGQDGKDDRGKAAATPIAMVPGDLIAP